MSSTTASPVSHATKDNSTDPDRKGDQSSSIAMNQETRPCLRRSDDDDDNDSIPPYPDNRPHLSYLRSEWTSQDLRSPGSSNDEKHLLPQRIVLPSCTPSSAIEKEVYQLQLGASGLCLTAMMITSLNGDKDHVIQWAPPLLGVFWLVLTAILYTRHDNNLLLLAQHGALVSAAIIIPTITTTITCISSLIMTSISFCLFFVTRRIQHANSLQQQHYIHQHATAQKAVDEAVHILANRRFSFLSIVSQEVQDAALMVITTLEQFSPSTILTNTHELLSACSIAVPIASISAINTTIKQVCYISSHLQLLARLLQEGKHDSITSSSDTETIRSNVSVEFDIGDLVQNVGDAMAGMAAKLDVNLILYHFDNGMHYTNVMGDEGAIRHGLLDLLRNILEGCTPGACIELGLNLESSDNTGKLTITFEITHTASPAIPDNLSSALLPNANLTVKLLEYLGGQLEVTCIGKNRTRYNITVEMEPGHNGNHRKLLLLEEPTLSLYKQYPSVKFSNEPTLEELNRFIDSLKGLKMVLHARKRSIFARHLTSCLASWNVDISHVPVVSITAASTASDGTTPTSEDAGGDTPGTPETPATTSSCQSPQPSTQQQPQVPSPAIAEEQLHSIPPTFVLIDDDVETLERKLREFRNQPPASAHALQHHQQLRRHKSSRSTSGGPAPNFFHQGTVAIIHFTSLTNYKRVRDAIRYFSSSPTMPPFSMPRLVVVPKPAGPRRFLTALHTAWHNSVVEPQFMPIATSPLSPTPHSIASVLQQSRSGTGAGSPAAAPDTPAAVETPFSDRSSHRSSPGEVSRRQRPGSGVYSPPAIMEGATSSDTGNYFPMMGATTTSPSATGQSSPGQGSSTTSLHHRAVAAAAAAGRRRSHTDHALHPPTQQELKQPLDTTSPSPPPPATTSSLPPLTPSDTPHQPIASTESQVHDTVADHPESSISLDQTSPLQQPSPTQQPSPSATAPASVATESTTGEKSAVAPKIGPRRGLKLNKKRKADKGSAFANVVSPPINVLLVEDNMINIAILSTWMKKHKIGCTVAHNGQEAVERWQQGGFHLVLMDLQLPVMSGIEATKKIRAVEKQQKIGVLPMNTSSSTTTDNGGEKTTGISPPLTTSSPTTSNSPEELAPSTFRSPVIIVALTASELESDRHAALAAGCNDFLTKPISLEWLEKKIIEWGCMQALIDFEGWRRWKRSTIDKPDQSKENKPSTLSKTTPTTPTTQEPTAPSKDEEDEEKKSEDKRKGIMLAGAAGLGKRRFSTFDEKARRIAAGRGVPGSITKSGSDSDLFSGRASSDNDRRQQRSSNKH